mmetsp:Transcript_15178/g.23999  ORF Transcript_15178/g.23999 Transcript_15178/m.23999 type:complete len:551 (-) Transcript_15178:39-1691(-)
MGLDKIDKPPSLIHYSCFANDLSATKVSRQWIPPSQPTISDANTRLLSHGSWLNGEERAISCMFQAYSRLTLTPNGFSRGKEDAKIVSDFLGQIEHCINYLGVDTASREYRKWFTEKYQNDECMYTTSIIIASTKNHLGAWKVNGNRYSFSGVAIKKAARLNRILKLVGLCLEVWYAQQSPCFKQVRSRQATRAHLMASLKQFDCAWADFENIYICERMKIEAEERQLLLDAVKCAQSLADFQSKLGDCLETLLQDLRYRSQQHSLVDHLTQICKLVTKRRKCTFDADVFNCARDYQRGDCFQSGVAEHLAASFVAVQTHLETMGTCLACVDAEIRKNRGLVQLIATLEEAQSMYEDYVRDENVCAFLEHVFANTRHAQILVPALRDMCAHRDPEMFVVLPRLVLLSLLQSFSSLRRSLGNSLSREAQNKEPPYLVDGKLFKKLFKRFKIPVALDKFRLVIESLVHGQMPCRWESREFAEAVAWGILVERAVDTETSEGLSDRITASSKDHCRLEVNAFLQDLEGWSVELQRFCSDDWSRLSNTLLLCLR